MPVVFEESPSYGSELNGFIKEINKMENEIAALATADQQLFLMQKTGLVLIQINRMEKIYNHILSKRQGCDFFLANCSIRYDQKIVELKNMPIQLPLCKGEADRLRYLSMQPAPAQSEPAPAQSEPAPAQSEPQNKKKRAAAKKDKCFIM